MSIFETPAHYRETFPATITVQWPTGPVDCCKRHADNLVALGGHMGYSYNIAQAPAGEGAQCKNCQNEAKRVRRRE